VVDAMESALAKGQLSRFEVRRKPLAVPFDPVGSARS
jgi:hypothetical protein